MRRNPYMAVVLAWVTEQGYWVKSYLSHIMSVGACAKQQESRRHLSGQCRRQRSCQQKAIQGQFGLPCKSTAPADGDPASMRIRELSLGSQL